MVLPTALGERFRASLPNNDANTAISFLLSAYTSRTSFHTSRTPVGAGLALALHCPYITRRAPEKSYRELYSILRPLWDACWLCYTPLMKLALKITPQRTTQYAHMTASLATPELLASPLAAAIDEVAPVTLAGQSYLLATLDVARIPSPTVFDSLFRLGAISEVYEYFDSAFLSAPTMNRGATGVEALERGTLSKDRRSGGAVVAPAGAAIYPVCATGDGGGQALSRQDERGVHPCAVECRFVRRRLSRAIYATTAHPRSAGWRWHDAFSGAGLWL